MKLAWKQELPAWVMLGSSYAVAALTWPRAPARLPVHFNLAGEVDRWGSKAEALLVGPIIATVLYLLLTFLPRVKDQLVDGTGRLLPAYNRLRLVILAFIALVTGFLIAPVWGLAVPVNAVIPLLVGGLFIAIGLTLPALPPNAIAGFRTRATLTNPEQWKRANRMGGRLFFVVGAAGIAVTPISGSWAIFVLVGGALVGAIVVTALVTRAA